MFISFSILAEYTVCAVNKGLYSLQGGVAFFEKICSQENNHVVLSKTYFSLHAIHQMH